MRRQRQIQREAQNAKSLGVARAVSGGVNIGADSSVVSSAQQIASRERVDMLANFQNIMIGRGVFAENKKITEAQARGSAIQTTANNYSMAAQSYSNQAQQGQQLFGAGVSILQNFDTINRVGTQITSSARDLFNPNPWQTTTYNSAGYQLK